MRVGRWAALNELQQCRSGPWSLVRHLPACVLHPSLRQRDGYRLQHHVHIIQVPLM